ncbi:50S ribosomal protein L18 [Candidatus Uhrbacteria bacterium]|nr:50S ribosomal protein L18 [Candidatus Uhrbacteria bacterium]
MKRDTRFRKQMRKRKIRAKVAGTSVVPRLSVFRGRKHIFLQIIDDTHGKTLVWAHERELDAQTVKTTKTERALALGKLIGQKARTQGLERIVFDRGGNAYHGRVQAVAQGARDAGLVF